MPEPKEHANNRGAIETVLQFIPGFRGYLKKDNRRESDDLQRDWLADRLQRSKRGLDDYARRLADAAQIDSLPDVDRLRGQIDKLIGRVRGGMQGYSGFFDLVDVDQSMLDRVYQYDVSLMEQVARLADQIDQLGNHAEAAGGDDGAAVSLSAIREGIGSAETAWDHREDILKGLE